MKLAHFHAFGPVCPVCRDFDQGAKLKILAVESGDDIQIVAGTLACSREGCESTFPIIDGIPILVPHVTQFVSENIYHLALRDDFSPSICQFFSECCGAGSWFDSTRQQISIYAHSQYGDGGGELPSATAVLRECLRNAPIPEGPILDLGCAVGGTTFELARDRKDLVLGVDVNIAFLKLARSAMETGRVSYPLRQLGQRYEQIELEAPPGDQVDFWACDASSLPFANASVAAGVALNLIDCVRSPQRCLSGLLRAIRGDGIALVASPYDWSPNATPQTDWLERLGVTSEDGLRDALLEACGDRNFEILSDESGVSWELRMHARSSIRYDLHSLLLGGEQVVRHEEEYR